MQTALILRRLWELRVPTAVVALFAVAAGLLVAYRPSLIPPKLESRKYDVGVARARILVDTPDSQVVAIAPKGAETLGGRANLIANLMVDGELRALIAKEAGIPPERLFGVGDPDIGPPVDAAAERRDASVLRATTAATPDGGWLPIIDVEAQAPTAREAQALAAGAVTGVSGYLDTRAATERVRGADRLRVSGIGTGQGQVVARGPRRIVALAVALFVFGLGCVLILGGSAVARALRGPHATDHPGEEGAPPLAVVDDPQPEISERAS